MGLRGPKSKFDRIACPNKRCRHFGLLGQGNLKGNGRYPTQSGWVRKFVCHSCDGVFCDRTGIAFYDLRTPEERVLLTLPLVLRGMSLRAGAGALEVKLDTLRFWLTPAAAHAAEVNAALLTRGHVKRGELDELWTFVRKNNFRGWHKARRARTARSGSGLRSRPRPA